MQGTATRKVVGGKLVRVDITYYESFEQVRITGDFFLHPEETIMRMEACLKGVSIRTTPGAIAGRLQKVLDEDKASLIGVSPEDIALTLEEALR